MKIRTAVQYAARHETPWPRVRPSDLRTEIAAFLGTVLGHRSRPNHAARAVSIEACFLLAGRLSGGRPGHPGNETKTAPMDRKRRLAAYQAQNGGGVWAQVTPRQDRRLYKKYRRTLCPAA